VNFGGCVLFNPLSNRGEAVAGVVSSEVSESFVLAGRSWGDGGGPCEVVICFGVGWGRVLQMFATSSRKLRKWASSADEVIHEAEWMDGWMDE